MPISESFLFLKKSVQRAVIKKVDSYCMNVIIASVKHMLTSCLNLSLTVLAIKLLGCLIPLYAFFVHSHQFEKVIVIAIVTYSWIQIFHGWMDAVEEGKFKIWQCQEVVVPLEIKGRIRKASLAVDFLSAEGLDPIHSMGNCHEFYIQIPGS